MRRRQAEKTGQTLKDQGSDDGQHEEAGAGHGGVRPHNKRGECIEQSGGLYAVEHAAANALATRLKKLLVLLAAVLPA